MSHFIVGAHVKCPTLILFNNEMFNESKWYSFQVLTQLGIIESDYFGLQYTGTRGEHLWLNLRNPISRQLGGAAPYRLQLRVKFFVQPHFLLQDSTR